MTVEIIANDNIKFTVKTGSVEPKTFHRFEDGKMVCYSYSIERDINGIETSRTEPCAISSIGFNNKDFTKEDYDYYHNEIERPKKGLVAWFNRIFHSYKV